MSANTNYFQYFGQSPGPSRAIVDGSHILSAIMQVQDRLKVVLGDTGFGAFISSHEMLGVLTEEIGEFKDEITANSTMSNKEIELEDIACVAILALASIKSGGTEH